MSRSRRWVILLLTVIALALVGWNLTNRDASRELRDADKARGQPDHTSASTRTLAYGPDGHLDYRLDSAEVRVFSSDEISWFVHPVMTVFDKNSAPTWQIKADKAKLSHNQLLDLIGHVEINTLSADSQLRQIATESAQINLITQDILSDVRVSLFGHSFSSTGIKMRGNLRSKQARLLENAETYYEIQQNGQ